MNVKVYNFSGVYSQGEYDFGAGARVFDLTALPGTSCYADKEVLREEISPRGPEALGRNDSINLIDSGDYHYMTYLLAVGIGQPFSLVLIDNHPDTQTPAFGEDILSCGGWVRNMLRDNPYLKRVLILGIDPALIGETEGLPAREDESPRVTVITAPEEPKEAGPEEGKREFTSENKWLSGVREQLSRWLAASGEPVYLSIDKDVLSREYARTDWDQGTMTLPQLLALCRQIKAARKIIGTDICGELSPSKGGTPADALLNAKANKAIMEVLLD